MFQEHWIVSSLVLLLIYLYLSDVRFHHPQGVASTWKGKKILLLGIVHMGIEKMLPQGGEAIDLRLTGMIWNWETKGPKKGKRFHLNQGTIHIQDTEDPMTWKNHPVGVVDLLTRTPREDEEAPPAEPSYRTSFAGITLNDRIGTRGDHQVKTLTYCLIHVMILVCRSLEL